MDSMCSDQLLANISNEIPPHLRFDIGINIIELTESEMMRYQTGRTPHESYFKLLSSHTNDWTNQKLSTEIQTYNDHDLLDFSDYLEQSKCKTMVYRCLPW